MLSKFSPQIVLKLIFTHLTLFLIGACSPYSQITPVPTVNPDQQIIFFNGNVLTMDPEKPETSALLVTGQKITAAGNDDEIMALADPGATTIDLQGASVMPGFVDPHSHLFNDAEQHMDMNLLEVQELALANGITAIGDLYVDKGFLFEMQGFAEAGGLQIRTSLYLTATDNCGRSQGDWWKEFPQTDTPGEMLRIGGIKIFADGGTCKDVALSYELSPGEGLGDLFFSQDELNELVADAQREGRQVAIHAAGDRAVELAQTAIEAALGGDPNRLRHRIEHNTVVRPELRSRYGEIGIVPTLFGLSPSCETWWDPPEPYRAWEWPWRALKDANPDLPVVWHGDDPYSYRVRPLDELYSLLTGNGVDKDGSICPAPGWLKDHTIRVEEALQAMTSDAAYALFREDDIGSLEPGKFADLIILSDNPMTVEPQEILEMEVWMTMVGGRTLHCAEGREEVCP